MTENSSVSNIIMNRFGLTCGNTFVCKMKYSVVVAVLPTVGVVPYGVVVTSSVDAVVAVDTLVVDPFGVVVGVAVVQPGVDTLEVDQLIVVDKVPLCGVPALLPSAVEVVTVDQLSAVVQRKLDSFLNSNYQVKLSSFTTFL